GVADRQRLDVEAAPADQRRDARQHARLVLDEDHESVEVHASAPVSTMALGRRIMLWRSLPAGTIGNTESSCSTRKSISTVPGCFRAAWTAGMTSLRVSTRVALRPKASVSLTKSGLVSGVAA